MINQLRKILCLMIVVVTFGAGRSDDDAAKNLYQIKESWTNSDNKKLALESFRGKKVVFAMIYTSCKSACPLITKKMKVIEKKLEDAKIQAEFVVVSFDSEHDSSERLAHFREHNKLTGKNWHLLSGPETSVRLLANYLNVKFSKRPGTDEILHDNLIFLFKESGEVARVLEGLSTKDIQLY